MNAAPELISVNPHSSAAISAFLCGLRVSALKPCSCLSACFVCFCKICPAAAGSVSICGVSLFFRHFSFVIRISKRSLPAIDCPCHDAEHRISFGAIGRGRHTGAAGPKVASSVSDRVGHWRTVAFAAPRIASRPP